jgi:hypothetical protein
MVSIVQQSNLPLRDRSPSGKLPRRAVPADWTVCAPSTVSPLAKSRAEMQPLYPPPDCVSSLGLVASNRRLVIGFAFCLRRNCCTRRGRDATIGCRHKHPSKTRGLTMDQKLERRSEGVARQI